MRFRNFGASLIAIHLRQNLYSLSNNKCFDDYFSTASLFLPSCTLTPLVGLEKIASVNERNRFALAANFAHLRYPPTRQHTTCALFHSLWKELRALSDGWLGRKGCRGIGNDLCRRDPRKPSLAGPSLLFKGSTPRCLGRSWPWAKILMKYLGPLWRRTL